MFFRKIKTFSFSFFHQMAHVKLSTRIVCISDTHSKYDFILPDGDILLHAGDLTSTGRYDELNYFLYWLKSLTKFRLKIIIAGNHDVTLDKTYYGLNWQKFHRKQENSQQIIDMFNDPILRNDYGIVYLQDQMFIDPKTQLKFYGRYVKEHYQMKFLLFYLVHGNLNFVHGHLMLNVIVKKFVQYGIKFH